MVRDADNTISPFAPMEDIRREGRPVWGHTETAAFLHVAESTLVGWRKKGMPMPPSIKLGGAVRYCPADVAVWLDAQTESAA